MRLRFGAFILDEERFRLERDGEAVALRPKVFDLLALLVRERARVVPREELVMRLWSSTAVGSGALSGLVNELRGALGEDGRGPSSIRTVHARGYQFVADVADVAAAGEREAGRRSGTGIDGTAWRNAFAEVGRGGARAWVASLPERTARRDWLAQAMREAAQVGFEVRAAIDGTEAPGAIEVALADVVPLGTAEREARRVPLALAFEVEEPAARWSRAGGLPRLLDRLGRAPVLILVGMADLPPADADAARGGGGCGLDDPRIAVVEIAWDRNALGPDPTGEAGAAGRADGGRSRAWGRDEASAGEGAAAMTEMLRVLARSDSIGFVAALRKLGFEPAPAAPIRALRRVAPGRRGASDPRDAETG